MDTSAPVKDSIQAPAVTTGKASNRISALAAQVFGPSVDGKQVSHFHPFQYCFRAKLCNIPGMESELLLALKNDIIFGFQSYTLSPL